MLTLNNKNRKLEEALERCCIQAVIVVDQHRTSEGSEELTALQKAKIVGMIRPLIDLNHPVRVLYCKFTSISSKTFTLKHCSSYLNCYSVINVIDRRVKDWFLELAKDEGKGKAQPPQNLSIVSPLVMVPISEMMRLTIYSRGVFDILYKEIFDGNCPPPTFYPPPSPPEDGKTSPSGASFIGEAPMDPSIANLLAKLQGLTEKNTAYEQTKASDGSTPPPESENSQTA